MKKFFVVVTVVGVIVAVVVGGINAIRIQEEIARAD